VITFPSKCWLVVYHDYFPLGAVYTYLASGAGCTQSEGTFRALTRGFIHWASGRIDSIEVNVQNPLYVHIRSSMKPSMKQGNIYQECLHSLCTHAFERLTLFATDYQRHTVTNVVLSDGGSGNPMAVAHSYTCKLLILSSTV